MYATLYDTPIRAAAEQYLPQWHWLWLKAQLIAESALDPAAVSPAGAQGIAQFMPPTWDDVRAALAFPAHTTPFDPAYAIKGAAWYLGLLRRQWRSPRAEDDRRRLVQASYNAGLGNVVKAQKRAGGATAYASIAARLHEVTGADHARETRAYVERIERIHRELVGV
ncbi:transglycosylase SLT domain-containing protein [Tahibacter soli]|uniref:Transglycosylase SLT domain-containing protein n=1 Tax=Tahibacter soli TaxID=2983605 RepID=A0A9X3YNF1_9GAMM|nr:transglycosylase SLT domain-containing protein [Tahibacter soli]MDC8013973.1 transglycosylase SLT domain-containing protein [Tahibacter soli]